MPATVWDSSYSDYKNLLENGDLRVRLAQSVFTFAMKATAKKIWVHNSSLDQWNASGTADPATDVGGFAPTSLGSSPYFAAAYQQTSAANKIRANFGANTITKLPSGFSTYNAAAGATVTWDTSFNASGNIAYSNGNLDAAQTNTLGYANALCSKASAGISSGDFAWEIYILSDANQSAGWIRSNQANTNYLHELGNSGGGAGPSQWLYNNSGGGSGGTGAQTIKKRVTRATNKATSGKIYWQHKPVFGTWQHQVGMGNSSILTTDSPNVAGSVAINRSSSSRGLWVNGSAGPFTPDILTSGNAEGWYLDTVNKRLWIWCQDTNRFNASPTADPATNTGGIDVSSFFSTGLFPIYGAGDDGNLFAAENYTDADFATAPDIPHPSGWQSLDAAIAASSGELSATDPVETLGGAAAVDVGGTLSATDPVETLSGAAGQAVFGVLAVTDPVETLSGVASAPIAGSLSRTDPVETAAATAIMSGDLIRGAFTDPKETLLGHARVTGEGTRRPAVEILNQLLPPPRLTGDPSKDLPSLSRWCNTLWDHLTGTHNVLGEMDALVRAVRVAQGTQTNVATEFVRVLSEVEQLQQTLAGIIQSQEE